MPLPPIPPTWAAGSELDPGEKVLIPAEHLRPEFRAAEAPEPLPEAPALPEMPAASEGESDVNRFESHGGELEYATDGEGAHAVYRLKKGGIALYLGGSAIYRLPRECRGA